jgi:hypothetical protein
MPFYTFIMDWDGGNYVSQVNAASHKSACVKWAKDLDISQVTGVGIKSKKLLIEKMRDEIPTPLNGLVNAWCATALIRGKLALINVVQTKK